MNAWKMIGAAGLVAVTFGLTGGASAQLSDEEKALVAENFKGADADESGSLTREEFEAFIRANADDGIGNANRVVRMGLFDRAFAKIDANGDSTVTVEEFQEARAQR